MRFGKIAIAAARRGDMDGASAALATARALEMAYGDAPAWGPVAGAFTLAGEEIARALGVESAEGAIAEGNPWSEDWPRDLLPGDWKELRAVLGADAMCGSAGRAFEEAYWATVDADIAPEVDGQKDS